MKDRKHLTQAEVDRLLGATRGQRHEARDRCLILLTFRHGLRVSEACRLRLAQVDVDARVIHVRRLKRGLSTSHPLRTDELRALKAWLKAREKYPGAEADALFLTERGTAPTRQQAHYLIRRYGQLAGLALDPHMHMLRHGCGFALADQGADTRLIQDYLGHRNIQNTVVYTATNPARFDRLWRNG